MSTTLCEECFPDWGEHEVLCMVPMLPCMKCGRYDDRRIGGLRAHAFRADPRPPEDQQQ